jgi:hypothetical protein
MAGEQATAGPSRATGRAQPGSGFAGHRYTFEDFAGVPEVLAGMEDEESAPRSGSGSGETAQLRPVRRLAPLSGTGETHAAGAAGVTA